jgi:predicted benzoate:H+ symporter BenE
VLSGLVALVVAASDVTLAGVGGALWAIVGGLGVWLTVERVHQAAVTGA